jgi:hypothetical protein
MRSGIITVSFAIAALAGCGTTTQFASTNPSPRPLVPRPAAEVLVFASSLPAAPFVEVGIIQARQSSELSGDEMPDIIAEMRRVAGQRGCDALVLNGARDRMSSSSSVTTTGSGTTSSSNTTTLEGYWGTCIVFVEPDGAVAARAGGS